MSRGVQGFSQTGLLLLANLKPSSVLIRFLDREIELLLRVAKNEIDTIIEAGRPSKTSKCVVIEVLVILA